MRCESSIYTSSDKHYEKKFLFESAAIYDFLAFADKDANKHFHIGDGIERFAIFHSKIHG